VPFVALMAWSLYGIQEIGMSIEDPFQRALKLEIFANTIRDDIADLLHVTELSPVQLDIDSPPLHYHVPEYSKLTQEVNSAVVVENKNNNSKTNSIEIIHTRTLIESDKLEIKF
jgi:hypothetical protein